ncbi:MAG: hypothetical protein MSC31_07615 [Solirubrobacteraceae bacterium MAG38_C4-C5]|nr:hypothetical protein [Candidatus Siliceabacter maunaloa]
MKAAAVARDVVAALREEGGLLAGALVGGAAPPGTGDPARLDPAAAALVEGLAPPRAFAVAAVREGYLLHYGSPSLVVGADDGLALLAGDRLYALGLARLAAAADVAAVRELADLITRCAQAHAVGDATAAQAAWEAAGARLAGPGRGADGRPVSAAGGPSGGKGDRFDQPNAGSR